MIHVDLRYARFRQLEAERRATERRLLVEAGHLRPTQRLARGLARSIGVGLARVSARLLNDPGVLGQALGEVASSRRATAPSLSMAKAR